MRFPLAAIFFLAVSFIFFVIWSISSFFLDEVANALLPYSTQLSDSTATGYLTSLPTAFGIICAVFFLAGILLLFFADALSEEPEGFYRRPPY